MINFFYLTILKFSLGIIFSISFFGAGKSILLREKIRPEIITSPIIDLINNPIILFLPELVFLINKIDFPAPKKEIEKIIPNENFKIVK